MRRGVRRAGLGADFRLPEKVEYFVGCLQADDG